MERLLWLNDFVILFLVCIHLTMVSGLPPDVNIPRYITVKEDVPIGSIIGSFTAIDPEGLRNIDVVTGSTAIVRIENSNPPGNWSIILNTTLDREITTSYILSFTADTNGPFPLTLSMNMFVQDVNDVHPRFENLPYNLGIKEDTLSGQTVYTNISASDPDDGIGGKVKYYLQDVTQRSAVSSDARFSIDENSGNISFDGHLDYETIKFFHYKVTAVDGGNLSATTDLFITVTDVQDTEPYFSGLPYMHSLPENTPSGTSVYKVNAFDGDTGVPNNVTYSFVFADPVNCSSFFGIDNATGEITVTSDSLDRDRPPFLEKNGVCEFIIQAVEISTDPGPRLNDTANCTLTLSVTDVNDNVPTFSKNRFTATITENSSPGTPLTLESGIQISVWDADQGANSDFSLGLSSFNTCLSITPTDVRGSANIILLVSNRSCFDFEVWETMTFIIIATESTTKTSSNVNVTLTILNENDNDPTFNQTSYNGSVVENLKDLLILQVHAIDNDAGMFGIISYSLEGDHERFIIDSSTGEITTKDDTLDRETKDTYLMTVVATDGGGRRSGMLLTITVTDANDEIPVFSFSYASRITEGSPAFPSPVTLQAKDNDQQGSENSHVIYRMATCTPNYCSNFTLDENSGVLSVNSTLDYEKLIDVKGIITIIVQAIDKGVPQLTGNTTVNITVEDKNDVHPVFSNLIYTANVPENAPAGQSVIQVIASDGDGSAPNNVVFYVLESGGSDTFRVNSTSGLITIGPGANLDREKDGSYSLTVLTVDRGDPPLSSTATVSISLVDVNDEPPKFNEQTYEFAIYENASVGDVNFVITADDPDTNHDLVYSLLLNESQAFTDRDANVDSSIFQSWFDISPSTGSLRVSSNLDREKAEMVILMIAVTDRNGLSNLPQTAKTSLRITLRDDNDNEPIITPTEVLNVSEALTIGTDVTTLTAVDLDKDQTVSFFVDDTTSSFQITPDGKVFVNRSLDRETSATLEFTVYAKDNGQPSMTSNTTIHVNVIDKNDNDPEIANTVLIFNVSEGAATGSVFGVISATDKDEGPNAMLTFGFSDIVNDFSINETTGELSVKRYLDRESVSVYRIGIIALDNPTTDVSRRASKQITINILDTNDNFPKFVNFDPNTQSYLGTVIETEPVNSSVTKMNPNMITAIDKDEGENARLSYNIHSVGGADYFIINPNSGVITVNANIVGHAGLYNYTLIVTDHGSVPLTVSANLTIKVVDVNLNKPIFRDSAPRIVVAECAPIGSSLYTFTADDADPDKESNGKVLYILGNSTTSPADANHFHLNEETGLLTSAATFDREIQSSFRISVTARDLGVPYSLETILSDVEIVLQDENDNPPVFNITRYTFEISESQMSGEVGTVVARDPDNDARTCYSIISGETVMSNYFSISTNTSNQGVLTLVKPLDREKLEQVTFVFSVTANDCSPSSVACKNIMSGRTSVTEVNITVLDVNDNLPNFTQPEYSRGFMTSADFGHVIFNLQELVTDPDTPPNRVHAFYPLGPLEMDQTLKNIPSVQNLVDPLILTKNGTVLTNVKFPADAQGLYKWRVVANDSAGNSTTLLNIYIVGEDKLVRITLFETEDRLRTNQFNIVRDISQQTGYDIVADDIKPFLDTNGNIDPSKSQLLIHAVTSDDTMLEASRLLQQMNHANNLIQNLKTSYQVLSIQSASMDGVNVDGCTCVLNNMTTSFISEEFTAAPPNRFTSPLPGCELPAFDLDVTCGLNNRTWGFCRTTNSSCAFAKGAQSGSRTCQCVHGNIAVVDIVSGERTCKEAPTDLFRTFYQKTVQSNLAKLSPVLNISLNTGNIAMDPVTFKITLHPSDSFLAIPNSDSSTFSIITISDLPQAEKSYQFFLEAEMTYGDVIVKDITSLTINVTRIFPTPPPIAGIFVLDGTRKGSIVYDISADLGSVDGLDLRLNATPPTRVFKLDKNRIVCTEDVQLARLQTSQDSIGHLVTLNISRTQAVVITIQVVILVNRRYIEIQENSPLSMKVAEFSSLVNSYDISLSPPYDDTVFGIFASQSYVQLLRNLDFENWNGRNYIFRLSIVSKHNLQIKTEVETEVAVVDVNDIPPQFDRSTYFFTVPAGSPAGTIIGILRVTDRDTKSVNNTYVIDNSNYNSIFKVESGTGAITASQDIQNMNSSIVFNVTVCDGVNLSRKPALVIISVSKIQPEMVRLGKSLEADVVEGQDVGMFVINASVANYTGYQLLPDVIKYNFTINSTTGVVTTVSPIDREGELEINVFSVIAYHIEEACSFKIVGNVSITIKDINDNSPVFADGGVYTVRLIEHASLGTSVFTVTAMDRDEGENSTLNFNLTGADSHLFTINKQTGTISVTNSSNLDREQKSTLQVTVIAEDGGTTLAPSARLSANASLSLILEDVNDNSPEFIHSIYNFTVDENAPAGTSVGNVTATDRDINENADIRYVLRADGSWGFFRMNVKTGLLQTTQPIDREQYNNFTLTILAIDNGYPEQTSSCLVAVKVLDQNDVTPSFKNIDNPRIIEEGSSCAIVPFLQVQAVDTDAGLNGQIYYTIDSGALLNIDNVTGNVTCQAQGLDYENETHRDISVTVRAHDMGPGHLTGMAIIRILLNDINDNQPEFLNSPYNISIPSATFRNVNSTVYVVMFRDRDSGANGEVDLTLNATSSVGENLLWIDDRGVIRVKQDNVYGTVSSKELVYEVVATDRGQSRLSSRTNFTVIVDISNATDEKIIDPDIHILVEERNCTPDAIVGRLSVGPQYTATFKMLTIDDTFTVNTTTGELLCHANLDRETKERHQLFVNVTAGNHHTYTVVVVTVTDVNDNAPKFELTQQELVTEVEESASKGYFILKVQASDNDAENNGTIVYSILGPKEPFAINATDGRIFVQTALNRESVSHYSLTIQAKDKGPQPLTSTTTVNITILDVNDNAPTFNSTLPREFLVPENADSLFEVGKMEATDPDYGLSGRVTYSITNVGQCPFLIHDEGAFGIIKLGDNKTLDFEKSRDYTCTIQASDSGDSRLNTTLDVTITVTDVNDNAPVFNDVIQSVNVSRDANTSYVIIPRLNVTDEDTGKNAEIAFSFLSVENSSTPTERDVLNYFDLDAVSGKIGIRKSLRDLPREAINLTVQAQDQGDPILSSVVQIEVVIIDNNTAPQFNQSVYKYALTEEDTSVVGTLLTVSAFDYENHVQVQECNCTYSIISVKAEKEFNTTFLAIDNKTGAVTLQQAIDREESGGIINVILQVTDHGLPPKSDQALLEITVSDINDNAPQFEQLLYEAIITKSHCGPGQPFFEVKARDSDIPPNDNTTYFLAVQTFQGIEINLTTGELILTESVCPQRYHNEKYTAIVTASDGYLKSSTNIFITVNHSDSNLHEPVFISPKYVASLSSNAKVGTTLQLVNFYANDSDGDAVNYTITSGNIVCPKSVFSIDSVTGVITVESEIEYLSFLYYNLTVTAVDTGDFSSYFRRTGTTIVEINVVDLTKTCYKPAEVEQLSSEAEQFQLFRGLFIGLAILLGIVAVLGVVFLYKWRVAKSDLQQNNSEIRFEMDPTGEQKGSTKVSSEDTRGMPPRLPPREQGYSGMEPGLNNRAVDSEGYLSPSEPSQSAGEQQQRSADSQQFLQRTGRMANTTGYLPLLAPDPTRFAERTPEKSLNRSKYLTPSRLTSSRDQESTAYLHPLPRPSISYYGTYVQATVDPDDVKPSFSPLAAHGSQQQNKRQLQPSFAPQSLADGRRLVSALQSELGQSSRERGDASRSVTDVRRDQRGIRPTRNLRGDDSNYEGGYRPMGYSR